MATDNALGHLELAALHVRNQFRELVGSDDPAVNAELVSNIRIVLAECVRIGKTLHGNFAAFDEAHRDR